MAKILRLILGDQLNSNHSWFTKADEQVLYVMMEVMQEQEYVMHHVQKILGFFAAMRNFAHHLSKSGHKVNYIRLDDNDNQQTIAGNLQKLIQEHAVTRFEYQLPDEYRLDEQLKEFCNSLSIETAAADTEHFFTSRYEVKEFFGEKNFLMENFYRHMRVKHHVLMQGSQPLGKRWNFDHDNRRKYDNKVPLVAPLMFDHDVSELKTMVDGKKVKYFGEVDAAHFQWPLSRKEALTLVDYFCENLLPHFGTYEDAMLQQHISLFHSRISFAQNVKMIAPHEVIGKVLAKYNQHQDTISLAQVEGYVRQILGWREFMRGVYWARMPEFGTKNYFDHQAELPQWFWTGDTKMNCLNKCIGQSLNHAWAHHIQRLMVIGNFALLSGMNPNEVDAWYLGVYIDAIQWVEITNTRGMSQYADGGVIASKPYVASAAYINKMSDYCKNCYYNYKLRHGEKSCPFNSLYWNFFYRNADKLEGNFRIGVMYKTLKKFSTEELDKINTQASVYLNNINTL